MAASGVPGSSPGGAVRVPVTMQGAGADQGCEHGHGGQAPGPRSGWAARTRRAPRLTVTRRSAESSVDMGDSLAHRRGPPTGHDRQQVAQGAEEHLQDTTHDDGGRQCPHALGRRARVPGFRVSTRAKEDKASTIHPTPASVDQAGNEAGGRWRIATTIGPTVQAMPTRYAAIPATASEMGRRPARPRQRPGCPGRMPAERAGRCAQHAAPTGCAASSATGSPGFP